MGQSSARHGQPIRAAPPNRPRWFESHERANLEPLGSILPVSGPQCHDRRIMLGVAGLNEARRRLDAEPGEPGPLLVPPIGEQAYARSDDEIPHASELVRIGAVLRLLVERRIDDRAVAVVDDGEADRDLPRLTVRGDRREDRPACGLEEREVLRTNDWHSGSIVPSTPTHDAVHGSRSASALQIAARSFQMVCRTIRPAERPGRQLIVRTGCCRAARTLTRAATVLASAVSASAAGPGSRWATTGMPASPPWRTVTSSGMPPRNSMSCARANRSPPPRPKISVASPQCGQANALMFSTRPMTGTLIRANIASAFWTSAMATCCGVVTSTAPEIGTDCASVSCASDVPGGRSTTR